MAATDAYLFGRKTYEQMATYWPTAPEDDPYAQHLNATQKYVASRTLRDLQRQNSTLIEGDVVEKVVMLKDEPGKNDPKATTTGGVILTYRQLATSKIFFYCAARFPTQVTMRRFL